MKCWAFPSPTPRPLPAPKAISPFSDPRSTYIHDAVLLRVEEEPIVEQSQFGIGSSNVGLEKEEKPNRSRFDSWGSFETRWGKFLSRSEGASCACMDLRGI